MSQECRQNIYPVLRYADAPAAMRFLEQGLGFERGAVHEGPDGSIAHAELRLGTAHVGLSSARGAVSGNPWSTVHNGIYVQLPVASAVDAHHARARAAGARMAMPLHDEDYGSREYSAWDPEGHLWGFGTYGHAEPGVPALSLTLRYADGRTAVAWLVRAFGFEPALEVPGPDGTLTHAELRLGHGVLMVSSAPDPEGHWGGNRQAQNLTVEDPDGCFARATAAGARVVRPPTDTPYGARTCCVRDPEGFMWELSTYRPGAWQAGAGPSHVGEHAAS